MDTEMIVFGGGCFWCTEAVFKMLKGVVSVEPGYTGPETADGAAPKYQEVSSGKTPYIETIRVEFDLDQIALEELLQVFFASHDPTTPNRQGNDVGPQYQSAIFYTTDRQREKAQHYIAVFGKSLEKPIVTHVLPLEHFYEAEDYHKDYFANNASAPYCQLVILPKIEKVEEKFDDLLK